MFLQNNCINKGVTNGLKQKKEKKHAKQLYLVVYTTTVNFQMNIVYRRKIKNGKKREGGGGGWGGGGGGGCMVNWSAHTKHTLPFAF